MRVSKLQRAVAFGQYWLAFMLATTLVMQIFASAAGMMVTHSLSGWAHFSITPLLPVVALVLVAAAALLAASGPLPQGGVFRIFVETLKIVLRGGVSGGRAYVINPATGMRMTSTGVDTGGNVYGQGGISHDD